MPLWSIVGGKLTTCRSLAETTAATVLGTLRLPVLGTSRERPLPGACSGAVRDDAVRTCRERAEQAGVPRDRVAAVADDTVALFGSRAATVWRRGDGSVADGRLIRGVGLPRAAVGFCVREEWAATLDDLIERRLMLSFHKRLSRAAIADVAESLADAGALPSTHVAAAVDGCAARLEARYGRSLPDVSDEPDHDATHVPTPNHTHGETR